MNPRRLLAKAINSQTNLRFEELVPLAEAFGFEHRRTQGCHRIFGHPRVDEILNFQPDRNGKAKAYQVRKLLDDVEANDLRLED